MKRIIPNILILFSWMLLLLTTAQAQNRDDNRRREGMEKIKTEKIAFLNGKLNLTTEQSQKFWPIFNKYEEEKHSLRHKSRVFRDDDIENMTDQQLQEGLNKRVALKQQEVNMEKQYMERFQTVLSVRQLALLYRSEREFTKALLKKLDAERSTSRR